MSQKICLPSLSRPVKPCAPTTEASAPNLAVIFRVHNRPDHLRRAFQAWDRLRRFLPIRIFVAADRPSPAVCELLRGHFFGFHAKDFSHIPILSPGKDRFLEAQNAHLEWIGQSQHEFDWIMVADDDFWFEPTKAAELLPAALARTDIDAYYCECLAIRELPNFYDTNREHRSIRLYRNLDPTARFSGDRMLSIPDVLHDAAVVSGRTATLGVPLLEYVHDSRDRLSTFYAYKHAGKDDPYTQTLIAEPNLKRFPKDWDANYGNWTDLWTDPISYP